MNLLERVLTLLRANVNTMVEKADDPEHVLRQLQQDMRNQLMQVKTQVATAIAESHKLQSRYKEKLAEAEVWQRKVEQAIHQKNDTAARAALTKKNDSMRLAERYRQQQKEQDQFVLTMRGVLSQLETKIGEVEATVDLLTTRRRNALVQQRTYDALSKAGSPQGKERVAHALDALMEAEARARAQAELHSRGLDVELAQISEEQLVEQQLNELKSQMHTPPARRPLLHEGHAQPAPLIVPPPQDAGPAREPLPEPVPAEDGQRQTLPQALAKDLNAEQLKKLLES
ncbi:MAG: PspA/IM30 family protein [Ktedonobacteraceae bacterium]|nr:PspA/IM30 family protein [Chloroflexota bacterium]